MHFQEPYKPLSLLAISGVFKVNSGYSLIRASQVDWILSIETVQ
jgi:hypothetical protein